MSRLDKEIYTNASKCVFDGDLLATCGVDDDMQHSPYLKVDIYSNIIPPRCALGRVCNTHSSSKTSLSGFDVTMIVVATPCSDRL